MKKIVSFFNSIYFIILVNIIAIVFWSIKEPLIAYLIYLVFCILIILLKANRIAIASLILSAIISLRFEGDFDIASHPAYAKIFIPLGLIVLILFVIDIIRRKSKFKLSPIFYGALALLIANILSLVNVIGRDEDLILISTLGVLQLLGYLVIYLYFLNSQDENSKKQISSIALITAAAITVELFIEYCSIGTVTNKGDNNLFWAVSNTIAMFYLVLIPIGLYNYLEDQKKWYILIISGFNIIMMLFMLSRGAYLALAIIIIPASLLFLYMVEDRKRFAVDAVAALIICLAVSLTLGSKLGLFDMLNDSFTDLEFFQDNGRMELYKEGWDLFLKYPIFGAGSYSSGYYLRSRSLGSYHNYLIQAIATTGIVGLLSLVYFIFIVIKTSFQKNKFNLLFLISFGFILVHGMVDNSFYNPIIMIFLACTMPSLEHYHEDLIDLEVN